VWNPLKIKFSLFKSFAYIQYMQNFIQTPLLNTDAYKLSHWCQAPEGTSGYYNNMCGRKSRVSGIDKIVFFGLQAFLKDLNDEFNNKFFNLDEDIVVENYNSFHAEFFGQPSEFNNEQVRKLHKLGYLPILVKALPEGSVVNHNVPFLTVRSTDDELFWFTQWLETWMSQSLWKPCTSATTAYYYRKILEKYNKFTSDIDWIMDFQMHDFSSRGMSGLEDAMSSGAGHLLSFKGTDTIPAIEWIKNYYPGENGLIGTSVPATEHAISSAYLPEISTAKYLLGESDTKAADRAYIKRILELYPAGIISVVADTYDFWTLVTEILPEFKAQIMSRDGKLVIRPDSSPKTPVEMIIGDSEMPVGTPEHKGLVQCLYEIFGGDKNSKGYIDLNPHISCIYGDSITREYAEAILAGLEAKGFSSNNIVFGVGSFSYQYCTRDSHSFAIKCTAVASGSGDEKHWRATFKDPKTDNSGKKSARGFLRVDMVDGEYVLTQDVTEDQEGGAMIPVYENGKILRTQSFAEVRAELAKF
jgi:nicotinamide phosphoribosyltransferase